MGEKKPYVSYTVKLFLSELVFQMIKEIEDGTILLYSRLRVSTSLKAVFSAILIDLFHTFKHEKTCMVISRAWSINHQLACCMEFTVRESLLILMDHPSVGPMKTLYAWRSPLSPWGPPLTGGAVTFAGAEDQKVIVHCKGQLGRNC